MSRTDTKSEPEPTAPCLRIFPRLMGQSASFGRGGLIDDMDPLLEVGRRCCE